MIEGHRRKPNLRIQLPARIQAVLRKPNDETSWSKLEAVRKAVASEIQSERQLHFTTEELAALRDAILVNRSRQRNFSDEVGRFERGGGLGPAGALLGTLPPLGPNFFKV